MVRTLYIPYCWLSYLGRRAACGIRFQYALSQVCVCVTLGIKGNLLVWNRGRDGRFPSHANEAMEIDWMEVWTQTSVLVPLFGKTGGNRTRHTCVSGLLYRFAGRPPNFVRGSLT